MGPSGESMRHTTSARGGDGGLAPPPHRRPYDVALRVAYEQLRAREITPDRLSRLGARLTEAGIRVPALHRELLIRLDRDEVLVEGGGSARHDWALLALHYVSARDLTADEREVTLSHFADARGYLTAYNQRIIARFLATVGATDEGFRQRAAHVQATALPWRATCFRFAVFPRLPLTLIRYEGDEEFPPGANLIFRADAERLLPIEDRIVAAEMLIDTLSGVPVDL